MQTANADLIATLNSLVSDPHKFKNGGEIVVGLLRQIDTEDIPFGQFQRAINYLSPQRSITVKQLEECISICADRARRFMTFGADILATSYALLGATAGSARGKMIEPVRVDFSGARFPSPHS